MHTCRSSKPAPQVSQPPLRLGRPSRSNPAWTCSHTTCIQPPARAKHLPLAIIPSRPQKTCTEPAKSHSHSYHGDHKASAFSCAQEASGRRHAIAASPADAAPLRERCCLARDTVSLKGLQLGPRGGMVAPVPRGPPDSSFLCGRLLGVRVKFKFMGLCFPGPSTPLPEMGPGKYSLLSLNPDLF